MTTLITWYHGGKTRRCDGTCHDAKLPKCRCICGGRFHGIATRARTEHVTVLEEAGRMLKEQLGGEVTLPALQLMFEDMAS